ncbi:MAG TPA: hypothetical protein PLH94_13265 [Fimbriimonadaceae bacterium]|nr:hypothetical protein [Fimbriimonadaceae bacterium]
MVYRFRTSQLTWGLVPLYDQLPEGIRDPRVRVGPDVDEGWTPPPLMLRKAKGKAHPPDIWDYDQGCALAVTGAVAAVLDGASWCRLFPLREEVQVGSNPGVREVIDRVLVVVTSVVDVMDPERTTYKPYGDHVLDFDRPGAIVPDAARVPASGLFHQPTGASTHLFATEGFRALVESKGWTGLEFVPLELTV